MKFKLAAGLYHPLRYSDIAHNNFLVRNDNNIKSSNKLYAGLYFCYGVFAMCNISGIRNIWWWRSDPDDDLIDQIVMSVGCKILNTWLMFTWNWIQFFWKKDLQKKFLNYKKKPSARETLFQKKNSNLG